MNDMTNEQIYRNNLKTQLRENYGKATYSYTVHNEMCNILLKKNNILKIAVIISSSISSFGFIGTVVHNAVWINLLSGIFSFLTLALTLYSKEENIAEIAQKHKKTADELWIIREDYISLLTDYDELAISEIQGQRHILQERL